MIGAALFAAGTVASVFGQIQAGQDNARASRASARLLELQAQSTIVRGRAEASRAFALFASKGDTARSSYASGNIDVSTGTARIVQEQFMTVGKLEAEQINANAKEDAAIGVSRAQNLRSAASAQETSSLFGAAGSFLTGAGMTATLL